MTTTAMTAITYKTARFEVRALSADSLERLAAMRKQAEIDYNAGRPVMSVYVSSLGLEQEEFDVPMADYPELKEMVVGHLQIANVRQIQ